ncbi:MAG TPA: NHL repeat-containing protein [Candidatus Paceibacterota bacterium]|nr:NHL repeat-containing protein [Candidatus Paceibacterota bacterium]
MKIRHHNPLHIVAVAGLVMVLVAAYQDPDLSRYLVHWPGTGHADFSEDATDVLGQVDGADTPYFTVNGVDNQPNARSMGLAFSVAIDAVGHRLFATDSLGNNRVLVFNLDVNNQLTDSIADAVLGQPDFKSNDPDLSISGLDESSAVAYDPDTQLLYVEDMNNARIVVYDVTSITNGEDAVYVIGQDSFTEFDGFQTTAWHFDFSGGLPGHLAIDSEGGRLFVADSDGERVLVFDVSLANLASEANGLDDGILMNAEYVIGQPDFDTAEGGLVDIQTTNLPLGVAFLASDSQDLLFVADSGNHRILVFDVTPGTLVNQPNAIRVLGHSDFDTQTNGTSSTEMWVPAGLSIDESGPRLFIAERDNNRVTVFDISSIDNGEAAVGVLGQEDLDSNGAQVASDGFEWPYGIAYDGTSSRLFVADSSNRRILEFDVATVINGEEAVGGLGHLDESDSMVFTTSSTTNPQGMNTNNGSTGVALDDTNHRLFVSDSLNARVLVFELDVDNTPVDHTADFVLGQPDFFTIDAGVTQTKLTLPLGLAYDPTNDRLFVADSASHRVMVFDTAAITNGEGAINVVGQLDFSSSDFSVDQIHLNNPSGVAYDPTTDRLFVADTDHNRVMVFDADPAVLIPNVTNGPLAVNELGQDDSDESGDYYDTSNSATSLLGMSSPIDVTLDEGEQRLFVSDRDNNRVTVFDVDTTVLIPDDDPDNGTNGPNAINVLGQPDFSSWSSCGTPDASCFDTPNGIFYDAATGDLLVADYNNNRILEFSAASGSLSNDDDAVEVWGQPDFATNDGHSTTQSGFSSPTSVVRGSPMYVVDGGNNRVVIFGTVSSTPTPGGQIGNPIYYPPGYTGFFPIRITVNDDDSSTDSRNVIVQVYADFTDSFAGTVDLMLSNVPDFSTFLPFRYVINNAVSDRLAWPKTISWDLCFGLPADQPCNPGQKTVYARFYPNIPQPTPARITPTPILRVSPTATLTPTPVMTTIIPKPVCPTNCRQLGLYEPGEVTETGCTSPGPWGYNTCLRSDPSVTCKTIHRAAGPNCYVPNQHTNYCFRCP